MNKETSDLGGTASGVTEMRRTGVDLGGLMTVLSKHLYSTPMVALRELVQNAHDSIIRRRLEQPDWKGTASIRIQGDMSARTLRITDTGAGLTHSEIHAYLATVGVGYTRRLRESGHDNSGLIGMFGLGFLSAFVLAKRVTVNTTSYQTPDQGHAYQSTQPEHYSVSPIPARPIGTEIILELKDEYLSLTSTAQIEEILQHYCVLLPEPIYIADRETAINPEPPPWRQTFDPPLHPVQLKRLQLEFAAKFEHNFEPIVTMPVTPGGDSDAMGMLWIQSGSTYGTSDNRNLSVFVRGMLLDDDARDLLPAWAGFVGGIIESTQLTPTASREDLQRDKQYHATQHALIEALIDGLSEVARTQPEAWQRVITRHNEALLGASLCDERLFDLMQDTLKVPTSRGDLPVKELLRQGALHVLFENRQGFEEVLFRALGIPVAHGHRYAVVPFMRRWAQAKGVRLVELGTEQGNRQLFSLVQLDPETQAWLEGLLCESTSSAQSSAPPAANVIPLRGQTPTTTARHAEKLIASRFSPASLPLIVVPDRDVELKRRLEEDETNKKMSLTALRLARQFSAKVDDRHDARLYVNLDNPAIQLLIRQFELSRSNESMHEQAHQAAERGARLLKAFKTLMGSDPHQTAESLQDALTVMAQAVDVLVKTSSH